MSFNIDALSNSQSFSQSFGSGQTRASSSSFAQALLQATQNVESANQSGAISSEGADDILMAILMYLLMPDSEGGSGAFSAFDMLASLGGSSDYGGYSGYSSAYGAISGQETEDESYEVPSDLSSLGISAAASDPSKYTPIVSAAMTRLGDPYSQARAGSGDYTDCSYLSRWCYRSVGVEIPRTAAEQARYCDNNNMTISRNELKPGDLIFYSHDQNGRYKNITHVGIYAGNGMMVDASSARGEVVYRQMYDGAVMYGRPR